MTFPLLPPSSLLRLLGIVDSLPRRARKSSECSTPFKSNKERLRTVAYWVWIQICLFTIYDSCVGLLPPQQQAGVKCVARLIISNCAPVPALTFLIIGVTFFQQGFDISSVDFPRRSAIDFFIRIKYLRRGILSEGSAFFLQKTPASYQSLSKGSYPGSPLRGFDTLWPPDILPSVSRSLADAGGATCSVYTNSSVHGLLLNILLAKYMSEAKRINVGCLWTVFSNVGQRSIACIF